MREEKNPSLRGKNVLVVGLGKSGTAAARLLVEKGARVSIVDQRRASDLKAFTKELPASVKRIFGQKSFSADGHDLVILSPGVRWDHPSLVSARKKKIPVWPELELGWRFMKPRFTIAVTGTNGKTTTTALIGHVLQKSGRPTVVGGNIGTPLSALTNRITPQTNLVVEVSSYQLEAHESFHPNVGVFLNLTPDHLARHRTMRGYATAKKRLLANLTSSDTAVYNARDRWCRWIVRHIKAKKISFPSPALRRLGASISLRGEHNVENAMAAAAACRSIGVSAKKIRAGLHSFRAVPHRIEPVAKKRGVLYVNDSKGTNVDSTLVALKSFSEPVVLLIGGEHKGTPYTPLRSLIKKNVRAVIAYGESKRLVEKDLRGSAPIHVVSNLAQAVPLASRLAHSGDVALLSPAAASFDQYKNFEERGAHFVSLVRRLPS